MVIVISKKTSEYWKKRFEILESASNSYGLDTYRQIEPAFEVAQRQIEQEIDIWFGRFAKNNSVTIDEARKFLTTAELKEFKWDVQEYIKKGRENALNQQWVRELENASAKYHISRLEALKIRTQNAAEVAFGNELDQIDAMARKVYTNNYYRSIFEVQKGFNIGWDIGQIDEKKLSNIISKPWAADGKNFSERIWGQRTQLVNELHQQLTRTCVLGKSPDGAIESIAKKFDVTKKQAGRLVMTEQAYFHSISQKDAFNELDVEEFEIVATLDSHTSSICQEMDGQHFPMKDYEPGVTAPPFHVWCRSVTVPYFEDNYGGERAARDEDGNTYYVPDSMTYKDWEKAMVDGDFSNMMSSPNSVVDLRSAKPIKHSIEEYNELESYANERGIAVHNIDRFDGDSQILKEQIDTINDMRTEYGLTDKLTITFDDLDSKDLAVTHNGRTIVFNRCALRDRNITNAFLNADDHLSSTDIKGIAAHEMGHVLSKRFGNKGLDISKQVYYNIYGEFPSNETIVNYLFENVSQYSVDIDEMYESKPFKSNYMKEIIPEIFGMNLTNPDEFTIEYIKLLKGAWNL